MIRPGEKRALRLYTQGLIADRDEDFARKMIELGEGSVWRYRPPSSPEWPEGYWEYAAGDPTLTREDIEAWIATKYVGDWAPDRANWRIERIDRIENPSGRRDERAAARRFLRGLSREQIFDLGDHLVLGTFDWREWMNKKPSPAFMRALDQERLDAEDADANPARKRRAGGKKTPPNVVASDWTAPRMTVVANRGKARAKKPRLVDATRMARKHPGSFELPDDSAIEDLGPGDFAKVSTGGERFWVRITKRKGKKLEGLVDNDLLMGEQHGLVLGDAIAFEVRNLYDAVSMERMNMAHADALVANPYGSPPPVRRSDQLRELEKRHRKIRSYLDELSYILDHGKPSSGEREGILSDRVLLDERLRDTDAEIEQLESEIELRGDIIGDRPPISAWGAPRRRNAEWITEEGSLGEGFLTTMSFSEQKKAVKRALTREKKERGDYESAYRSTLGKIMVLNRARALRKKYGPEIDRIRDWFVGEYGAGSRRWPKGRGRKR